MDALSDEERYEFEQTLPNASDKQKELYEEMVRTRAEMALVTEPVEQLNQTLSATMNTFAITFEPKGGMSQPSGDMYLIGQGN